MNQSIKLIELTEEQTNDFRHVWESQRSALAPSEYAFVRLRIACRKAKFTQNQLYRALHALARTDAEIPKWASEVLYKSN